ncbi:hypothetical protein SNEBB_011434 [Seison nebaliae]|nr:hypothetical protein SNEBB_011434 [Seison nebaliae]
MLEEVHENNFLSKIDLENRHRLTRRHAHSTSSINPNNLIDINQLRTNNKSPLTHNPQQQQQEQRVFKSMTPDLISSINHTTFDFVKPQKYKKDEIDEEMEEKNFKSELTTKYHTPLLSKNNSNESIPDELTKENNLPLSSIQPVVQPDYLNTFRKDLDAQTLLYYVQENQKGERETFPQPFDDLSTSAPIQSSTSAYPADYSHSMKYRKNPLFEKLSNKSEESEDGSGGGNHLSESIMKLVQDFNEIQYRIKRLIDNDNMEKKSLIEELEQISQFNIPTELFDELQKSSIAPSIDNSTINNSVFLDSDDEMMVDEDLPNDHHHNKSNNIDDLWNELKRQSQTDHTKITEERIRRLISNLIDESSDNQFHDEKSSQNEFEDIFRQFKNQKRNNLSKKKSLLHLKTNFQMLQLLLMSYLTKKTVDFSQKNKQQKKDQENQLREKRILRNMKEMKFKNPLAENHWGDIRAEFEIVTDRLIQLCRSYQLEKVEYIPNHRRRLIMQQSQDHQDNSNENEKLLNDSNEQSKDDSGIHLANERTPESVIDCVRKEFIPALQILVEHGLTESINENYSKNQSGLFGCFSSNTTFEIHGKEMTAWRLLLKYFDKKNGKSYIESAPRKLSEAFTITVEGSRPITIKENLLTTIDSVHQLYRRRRPFPRHALDTYHSIFSTLASSSFKAFVSKSLNENRLGDYFKLLFRYSDLFVEEYYTEWSYVRQQSFADIFPHLDRLSHYKWNLPLDFSLERRANIIDIFE